MALLLPWLNVGLSAFLLALFLVLYVDARTQRKTFGAAQAALATLQRRATARDVALGRYLWRRRGLYPHRRTRASRLHGGDEAPAVATAATARRIEALALPLPAVDAEGDRQGLNPGDVLPGDAGDALAPLDAQPFAHCNRRPDCQYTPRNGERPPAGIDPVDWRSLGACACACADCGGAGEPDRESPPPSSGRRSRFG